MTKFDELFWAKVLMGPNCWLYQGAINQSGYGTLNRRHIMKSAHRTAWEQAKGPVPEGMQVLHRCDVRHCCRPSHLFLGTNAENMADKVAKGRQLRGESLLASKLDELAVREIRQRYKRTASNRSNAKELAERFGVRSGTITGIIRGSYWKHVE